MSIQYAPHYTLHMLIGFSMHAPPTERFRFDPRHDHSQSLNLRWLNIAPRVERKLTDIREYLKGSGKRVLYVAIRQPIFGPDYRVGRFQIDKRGRVRFYVGWPAHSGMRLITTKRPFPKSTLI